MSDLRHFLAATPRRLLLAIGRARRLSMPWEAAKSTLVEHLHQALLDPAQLEPLLSTLAPAEQAVLNEILLAGGRLPRRHIARRYGDIRPYRPWQAGAPRRPWDNPASPPERLWYLGLIFLDRANDDLVVPTDLAPYLPAPSLPAPVPATAPTSGSAPVDLLCHDLTLLLAFLQRDQIQPRHGRWLPPRFLAAWGQASALPPLSPQARSELQTGRRRFCHYLAETAGFVAARSPGDGPLIPTPAAWLWLNASRRDRLQTLWQAWTTPDPDRWRTYRWPGHTWLPDPALLLAPLHQALTQIDPADPAAFTRLLLAARPALLDLVPANFLDPDELLGETIEQLLTGPLLWLGLLQKAPMMTDGGREREPADRYQLTPQGDAWLTGQNALENSPHPPAPSPKLGEAVGSQSDGAQAEGHLAASLFSFSLPSRQGPPISEELSVYAKFSLTPDIQPDPLDSSLVLKLEAGLPEPVDLATAIILGRRVEKTGPERPEGSRKQPQKSRCLDKAGSSSRPPSPSALLLTIDATGFISALHRGWSPPALLAGLNRLAERSLTGREMALLRTWAKAATRMTIRQAAVLETTDPEIIVRLASGRRGRDLIHRTLSPRAVIVDPARLDRLISRLIQQERIPPYVITDRERERPGRSREKSHPAALSSAEASHLWLAVRVYQQLGEMINLPVRTPQTLLDRLAGLAADKELAAAEVAADQTLAAIHRLLQGRTGFPPWPETTLSEEESLSIIEAALANGQALEMDYYTAGRDELTHRLVEPYRIQRQGEMSPYLVAFCHRAQAERLFRVDRIHTIAPAPLPDEPGQPWGE